MNEHLSGKKLAVLGTGKLGGILLRAYLKQGLFKPENVTATVKHAEKAAKLAKEMSISVATENRAAVRGADLDPPFDVHASSEYRTHLAEVLAVRAVAQASEKARG